MLETEDDWREVAPGWIRDPTCRLLPRAIKQVRWPSLLQLTMHSIQRIKNIIKDESSTVGTMNNEHEQ